MRSTKFIISLAFLFFSLNYLMAQKAVRTEVIILHTNDMHAKIDNLPKLAYLADSLRKLHPYVFLVSAGDNFTGNPVVDMVADKGYPMIDLMNRCHFDVSAIGNHEFDLGQEMLQRRMDQATFPFISCNIDASGGSIKQPQPYVVLNAGKDIHIAFLGIIELGLNGTPDSHPSKLTGLKFTNGLEKAKEFASLKEKYGILIGLTHLGIDDDMRLASAMPAFDLIIGGHSHTLIDTMQIVNNVPIVQAYSGLKFIGKTTLQIENGRVVSLRNENIPTASLKKADPEMMKLLDSYNNNEDLKKVAGFAEAPLTGGDELGSLLTDAITHRMNIDFAFMNAGGIRSSEIPQGDITYKVVYKLDPFGNLVVLFSMKLDEIRSLLRNSYNRAKSIDLLPSGMTYKVVTDASGNCTDVVMMDLAGKPLSPAKEYAVGMNSYVAASYKFDHTDPGTATSMTTAQILIEYLLEVHRVNYKGSRRVSMDQTAK